MTEFNKKLLAIIVSSIVMFVILGCGIYSVNKINKLENYILNLESNLTNMGNNLQGTINGLKNEIENELIEQNKNFTDAGYNIKNIDSTNKKAEIEVFFSLKESPKTGDVDLIFGKGSSFNEILATKLASGKYKADLEIDLEKDYELSYSAELVTLKSEKILEINIMKELNSRFKFGFGFQETKNGKFKLDFNMINRFLGDPNLKISSAEIEVYSDGTLKKTINALDYKSENNNDHELVLYEEFKIEGLEINEITSSNIKNAKYKVRIVDKYQITYNFFDI